MASTNGAPNGRAGIPIHVQLDNTPPRSSTPTSWTGGIVVFSGGSAANSLVDVFNDIREANNSTLSYVIPISDNGGSSSEIIRVFGGPGKYTLRTMLE